MLGSVLKTATKNPLVGGIGALAGGSSKNSTLTAAQQAEVDAMAAKYDPTKKLFGADSFTEMAKMSAYMRQQGITPEMARQAQADAKKVKVVKTAGISAPPSAVPSTTATAASSAVSNDDEKVFVPYAGYVSTSSMSGSKIAAKTGSSTRKKTSTKYDPEQDLQEMYKAQLTDYEQYQKPIIDELAKEAESNSIVQLGRIQSEALRGRVMGQTERSLGMNGSALLPSQRAAMNARMNNDLKLSEGGINRSAQIAQQEHNTATRTNLMSIAESLQTTGVSGVAAAAKSKAERDAAAAKAKGGMMSQVMSIAGGVVGGIYGGPMGAQAGAALGGMAGGAMGG